MPAKDQSSKLGSSPSPSINRIAQASKNNQQPVAVPAVVNKGQYNKQPISTK